MTPTSSHIGGATVLSIVALTNRHLATRGTAQPAPHGRLGKRAALAICADDGAFFLFTCDEDWNPVFDSWYETVDAARGQARFEYDTGDLEWVAVG